jgi:hypothetical protein
MRIAMPKEAFNGKITLYTCKANTELRKKLVSSYVWSSETWTLRKLKQKFLEDFQMWCWRTMKKIKWSKKVTNEEILEYIGEKRTLRIYVSGR